MDLLRKACSIAAVHLAKLRVSFRPKHCCTPVLLATCPANASPMLPPLIDDPNRWLECAVKMRLVAAEITDSDGKVIALRVVKDLEWFADWVDLRKNASTTNTR